MANSNEHRGHNGNNPNVSPPSDRELALLATIESLLFVTDTLFHLQGIKAAGEYGDRARAAVRGLGLPVSKGY